MLLQELLEYDIKELSQKSLFYQRLSVNLKIVVGILFLLIGISLFTALYIRYYLIKALLLLCMPICLYWIFRLSKKHMLPILQRHLHEAHLSSIDIWRNRNILIQKIQYHKLSTFILAQNFKNDNKILFIIDILKSETNKPKYKYQFLQVFLTLSSVIIAAFFAAITVVPKMFSSGSEVVLFFKPIFGFFCLFILFLWFCELMLIKNLFELQNSKHSRLISLLENYYLNEFQLDH